jgi:hypothetical protein
MTKGRKPGFWHDIARRAEKEFRPPLSNESLWILSGIYTIWFGRFAQIIAAATFVALITWCAFWGGSALQGRAGVGVQYWRSCLPGMPGGGPNGGAAERSRKRD